MIKRTLYFGNPAFLKINNEQVVIEMRDTGETNYQIDFKIAT